MTKAQKRKTYLAKPVVKDNYATFSVQELQDRKAELTEKIESGKTAMIGFYTTQLEIINKILEKRLSKKVA